MKETDVKIDEKNNEVLEYDVEHKENIEIERQFFEIEADAFFKNAFGVINNLTQEVIYSYLPHNAIISDTFFDVHITQEKSNIIFKACGTFKSNDKLYDFEAECKFNKSTR